MFTRRHLILGTIIVLALVILGSTAATATEKQSLVGGQDEAVVPGYVPAAHSEMAAAASGVYRRWIAVWNRADETLSDYPLEISSQTGAGFSHAALVAAGKAQADGDDLRVEVDGSEVDRWLVGPNTANTRVWVNIDLQAAVSTTLSLAYTAGDSLVALTVADTSGFPMSGVVYNTVSGEAFTYTGKDATHFVGVTRAVRGTVATAGNGDDTFVWIEHDVWLAYGDPGTGPPATNDDYKPVFDLDASTNTSWSYSYFGEDDGLRTGAWTQVGTFLYTGDHKTYTDPWDEMGTRTEGLLHPWGCWNLYNPCGIAGLNIVSAEKRATTSSWWAWITSSVGECSLGSWQGEYSILPPMEYYTWESWDRNEPLNDGTQCVWIALENGGSGPWETQMVEIDEAVVAMNSPTIPGISMPPAEFGPELAMTKSANPLTVSAGETLTYTIRVTNTGTVSLTAAVTDTPPAQVTPSDVLTWTTGNLAPDGTWSQQFTVTCNAGYSGTLVNHIEVVGDVGGSDEYILESFSGLVPQIEIAKSADPQSTIGGGQIVYTILAENTGNTSLTARITDTLPSQVSPSGAQIWTANIPMGGIWTGKVTVTAQAGYVGPLQNVVEVTTLEGASDVYTETSQVVPYSYGLALSPGGTTVAGYNIPLTFTHTLTNTADTTDTVQLSAAGDWLTGYDLPSNVTLAPGETAQISLYARVSGVPVSGALKTVTVTATSVGSPTVIVSAVDNVVFQLGSQDTDGDGVPDDEEGEGDSDNDGVPDWADYHGYTYLPVVMRTYTTFHVLNDAGGDCPGYPVQLWHRYSEDFDFVNDHDWYQFEAEAGQTYTLRTFDLGSRADTSMALFGMDCTTQLVSNDDADYPDDISSRIVWTAIADGTYHVQIRPYDWRIFGDDTEYTFWVREGSYLD
jgi:uncharacterized repeat protein (TIGR01451 family)